MSPDDAPPTPAELERELARMADEREELFARLAEVESERTAQTMELFTMAAHELRTPLQSLLMGTDLMMTRMQASADEISRQWLLGHLERQQTTLNRMHQLMESWLSAPELRAGTLPTVSEHGDLAEWVEQTVARHQGDLSWAGSSVELSLRSVVGDWDRVRIEAVLGNLLSNAVKYGGGKPILVTVDSDKESATIIVRDRGIGIAAADQGRIFERFERGQVPSRVPGFGVGLWMARALLRTIGGSLTVESAVGKGSAFMIRLPAVPHE